MGIAELDELHSTVCPIAIQNEKPEFPLLFKSTMVLKVLKPAQAKLVIGVA
jgi:hypothetical protein